MMPAIPFAGLAPDGRLVRGGGELSAFAFRDAVQLGRDLRRACTDAGASADVAAALLDGLNAFEHDGRSAWVLLQLFARGGPDGGEVEPSLRLIATRGIEPAWNETADFTGRRTSMPPDGAAPTVSEAVRQLRVYDISAPPVSTFYVAEAATSTSVPDKSFATAYGIRSIVGFCARPWPGQAIVLIGFARAVVERAAVHAFETLGLYARLAWIESPTSPAGLAGAEREQARVHAFDDLVASHETSLIDAALEWRHSAEAIRNEAQRAADASAEQVQHQNQELRRTQRAMLNVVEDLREARESLASKVEERTRELAETNLELQGRNRDLEEFAYIASHDLQEPLRTVAGYLQMIERRYAAKLGAEGDEFIRYAIDGAQRMQALIESLLLYSRATTKHHFSELVPLDDVVDVALQNLALRVEESHATIVRTPLPCVHADRIQIAQVFQNLLSNALKFAGPKPPRIHLTGEVSDGVCVVTVRDEGIGFEQKFADRIFKIFRRLRRDTAGTGIGLAVCKKIIERHGGTIEARSAPGAGATFAIRLPVQPKVPR
jgi:signal transduction histidine kinase